MKTKEEVDLIRCEALKKARKKLHEKPIWNKGLTNETKITRTGVKLQSSSLAQEYHSL